MKHILLVAALLAAVITELGAFTLEVNCPTRSISMNESIQMTISVVNAPASPAGADFFPKPDGLSVAFGGVQNFSSTQWINGAMKSEHRLIYNYRLSPAKIGKITLGPFTVTIGSEAQTSPAIEITVSAAPERADPVILRSELSRKSVYVGEPVTVKIVLGYLPDVAIQQGQLSNLQMNGAEVEKNSGDNPPEERKVYFGREYLTRTFSHLMIPTVSGDLEIPALSFTYLQQVKQKNRFSDPFFDDFDIFGRTQVTQNTVRTLPEKINVKPFPAANKPADFTGAVGEFTITAESRDREVKTNEPVTLRITISGNPVVPGASGNLQPVNKLIVPELTDFRTYPLQLIEKESNRAKRVFELVVIPIAEGNKTIPPLSFSYFDPVREKYQTIKTEPVTLSVTPGPSIGPAPALGFQPDIKQTVRTLNEDIRYINEPVQLKSQLVQFSLGQFAGLLVLPMLLYLASAGYDIRRRRLATDHRYRLMIDSAAQLTEAIKAANQPTPGPEAVSRLYNDLTGYISAVLFERRGGFDTAAVREQLEKLKIPADETAAILELVGKLERQVYAAPASAIDIQHLARDAAAVHRILDNLK